MDLQTLLTFALAFFVFAASPGPDNLTILSKTVSRGPAHGLAYGLGVTASIFCFVVLAAIGFSALARVMNENLRLLQYLGAAYLIYTGVMMWRAGPTTMARQARGGLGRLFLTGFALNLSNPKMPVFYLALLPGVLGTAPLTLAGTLELLLVVGLVEVIVIGGHLILGHRARRTLSDPRRLRLVNRGAGSLLIGAGVLVASR